MTFVTGVTYVLVVPFLSGLKESSRMPLADSALLTEIMDEARRQVGVVFNQDSQ